MLQQCGFALGNGGVEQRQVDGQVRVDVIDLAEDRSDLHLHVQLLPAFPGKGLSFGLARLHLSAHKLP